MNEITGAARSGAKVEWQLKLDCGHDITVPWGFASPAVMACVVQHRDRCEVREPDHLSGLGWWVAPLARAPVPSLR